MEKNVLYKMVNLKFKRIKNKIDSMLKKYSFNEACFSLLTYLNWVTKSEDMYVYVIGERSNSKCIGGTSKIKSLEDNEIKDFIRNNHLKVFNHNQKFIISDSTYAVPLFFDKKLYGYLIIKSTLKTHIDNRIVNYIAFCFYFYNVQTSVDNVNSFMSKEDFIYKKVSEIKDGYIAIIKIEKIPINKRNIIDECVGCLLEMNLSVVIDYDLIYVFVREDKVTTGNLLRSLLDKFSDSVSIKIVYTFANSNCVSRCYMNIYETKPNEIIYLNNDTVISDSEDIAVKSSIANKGESSDPFALEVSEDGGFANYFDGFGGKERGEINEN